MCRLKCIWSINNNRNSFYYNVSKTVMIFRNWFLGKKLKGRPLKPREAGGPPSVRIMIICLAGKSRRPMAALEWCWHSQERSFSLKEVLWCQVLYIYVNNCFLAHLFPWSEYYYHIYHHINLYLIFIISDKTAILGCFLISILWKFFPSFFPKVVLILQGDMNIL